MKRKDTDSVGILSDQGKAEITCEYTIQTSQ